jgi:hypothetical protein
VDAPELTPVFQWRIKVPRGQAAIAGKASYAGSGSTAEAAPESIEKGFQYAASRKTPSKLT